MSRFDDRYLNYGDVYSIIMQAKTVDQAMSVLHLPYVEIPKWIPVTERLPEEDRAVMVSLAGGWVTTDFYEIGNENFFWSDMCPGIHRVIAWMPLPEPYKGVKNNVE